MKITAKKSLGQHFLLNPTTIDKILRIADVGPQDQILEIGPGPGVMTERLAQQAGRLVAVEKDHRFSQLLQEKLAAYSHLTMVEGDFLSLDLEKLLGPERQRWKVLANLPYNIATEVIFHLLDSSYLFKSLHLMVQEEVAARIVAGPGTKDYGILSIFTQLFSENRIVMRLPPGAFTPPPKVRSAVVSFKIAEGCRYSIHHLPTFEAVVRAAFGMRRKMIGNALERGLSDFSKEKISEALKQANVSPTARAETVPIAGFVQAANKLSF